MVEYRGTLCLTEGNEIIFHGREDPGFYFSVSVPLCALNADLEGRLPVPLVQVSWIEQRTLMSRCRYLVKSHEVTETPIRIRKA